MNTGTQQRFMNLDGSEAAAATAAAAIKRLFNFKFVCLSDFHVTGIAAGNIDGRLRIPLQKGFPVTPVFIHINAYAPLGRPRRNPFNRLDRAFKDFFVPCPVGAPGKGPSAA